MELNTAVANLVPLTGLFGDKEATVPRGYVGVVVESALAEVVVVDFGGVLASVHISALLPLRRGDKLIKKYRLCDLLIEMPDAESDEDFARM